MLKIIDHPGKNVVETVAIARLTEADWARVIPVLQKRIEQLGKIRWYFEMTDFQNVSANTAWEEVGLHQLSKNAFERIAIVGHKDWQGWMKDLMQPFSSAQVQFFETIEQDRAHQWINS